MNISYLKTQLALRFSSFSNFPALWSLRFLNFPSIRPNFPSNWASSAFSLTTEFNQDILEYGYGPLYICVTVFLCCISYIANGGEYCQCEIFLFMMVYNDLIINIYSTLTRVTMVSMASGRMAKMTRAVKALILQVLVPSCASFFVLSFCHSNLPGWFATHSVSCPLSSSIRSAPALISVSVSLNLSSIETLVICWTLI